MFKKSAIKITRYEYKTDEYGMYYIDIVEEADSFQAWIQNSHSGLSSLMFGVPHEQDFPFDNKHIITTRKDFVKMVENQVDEYIEYWEEDLLDIEEMHCEKYEREVN